jgi:hypothetical protein
MDELAILTKSCPPAHTDLANSLISCTTATITSCSSGRKNPRHQWVLFLTSWPSNGFAIDVFQSLIQSHLIMTGELIGLAPTAVSGNPRSPIPALGRISCAAAVTTQQTQNELETEIWCFISGKRAVVVSGDGTSPPFELQLRYEAKTVALARNSKVDANILCITGGPRGCVIQTCEETKKTQVVASIWRHYPIRQVVVSPNHDFLLVCASTGHVGLWRINDGLLSDEVPPVWSEMIPSAAICSACFSSTTEETKDDAERCFYIAVSTWNESKNKVEKSMRPHHYVYRAQIGRDSIKVSPHTPLEFLRKGSTTSRIPQFLPPPSLQVFSKDGKLIAVTSSCSSISVFGVESGKQIAKWKCPSPSDEISGLVSLIRQIPENINGFTVENVICVRLIQGPTYCFRWPTIDGSIRIKESLFCRKQAIQSEIFVQFLKGLEEESKQFEPFWAPIPAKEGHFVVWLPKDLGKGCCTWLILIRDDHTDNVQILQTYDSTNRLGNDKVDEDFSSWLRLKIYLQSCDFDNNGDLFLKFSFVDGHILNYYPKLDGWKYIN